MITFQNLLIFLSVVLPGFVTAKNNVNFLTYSCSGRDNYEKGGAYEANLNQLLSNLTFNTQRSIMFYNFMVGETSNVVYGLFLCRGDTSPEICQECVMAAADAVKLQCPLDVAAMVWYEECILRYSDRFMFGIPLDKPVYYFDLGPFDYDESNDTVSSTLKDLIYKASFGDSSLGFASKVTNLTPSLSLDCYAECTPDIIGSGCNRCLEAALGRLQTFSKGGQYAILLQPSCRLRYNFSGIVAHSNTPSN